MTTTPYQLDDVAHARLVAAVEALVRSQVAGAQAVREAQRLADENLAAFCLELLAVLDTLEAQVAYFAAQPREAPWPRLEKNMRVTCNKLVAALATRGVVPISVEEGQAPDYRVCVAVERRTVAGVTAERVAEVLRGGWLLGDAVLRAAEVAIEVAQDAAEPA